MFMVQMGQKREERAVSVRVLCAKQQRILANLNRNEFSWEVMGTEDRRERQFQNAQAQASPEDLRAGVTK